MEKNPVLFVHGVGTSAGVWKRFTIPGRNSYYISFSNRFAHPKDQVAELKDEIGRILKLEGKEKVVLVCHSMGGLVARKYLADHLLDHHVEKLVLLSTPNLGSIGLSFNWFPILLIITGIAGFKWIWPLLLILAGTVWETVSFLRGVLLLSPAVWAMRPDSRFIRGLNAMKMPTDLEYVAALNDANYFPHGLVNLFLFREGGDGAVPLSSQKLSQLSVPNFSELHYSELRTNLPHFALPRRAQAVVLQALGS
jgi:pimeloyl-ACP methyl ester carboxylesterase